ncbi:GntR family transcriptional regulator [Amycolatopsis minnesotensis]
MSASTSSKAPFEQVAERIRLQIRSGELGAGDKLPPHRELADKFSVALGTAQKALRLLQDEGWVEARQSIGVFVREDWQEGVTAPDLAAVTRQVNDLSAAVAALAERVQRIEGGATAG